MRTPSIEEITCMFLHSRLIRIGKLQEKRTLINNCKGCTWQVIAEQLFMETQHAWLWNSIIYLLDCCMQHDNGCSWFTRSSEVKPGSKWTFYSSLIKRKQEVV